MLLIEYSVHFPLSGAWSAELTLGETATPAVGDTIEFPIEAPGGALVCVGRIVRAGAFGERVRVRATGGEIDWSAAQPVKHYHNTTVAKVAADVGITLSDSTALPFWTRNPGTTASTIEALARQIGLPWRVSPAGVVSLAEDTFPAVDPEGLEVARDDARGLVTLAIEKPALLPATTLPNGDLSGDVFYDFGPPNGLRVRYYTQARARLRGALERLVRWVTRDSLYLGQYTCQVMRQAGDGTLDLLPDDTRLRAEGLQAVPIRLGLPGVTVEVPAGERVLLAFDGGNPAAPYAALWHAGQATKLVMSYGTIEAAGADAIAMAAATATAIKDLANATNTAVQAIVLTTGILAPAKAAFLASKTALDAQLDSGILDSTKLKGS